MLQRRPSEIGAGFVDPDEPVRFMPHWFMLVRSVSPWFIVLGLCYGVVWLLRLHPRTAEVAVQAAPFALLILGLGYAYATLRAFIQWRYAVVSVFPDRLEYRTGFLTTRTSIVEVGEIANLEVRQSLFQRLLGFGDLFIDSRASAILAIRAVSDVVRLQGLIRDRRRAFLTRTDLRSSDGI